MRKKALLAVMMAMVLLLSGCALVVKDELNRRCGYGDTACSKLVFDFR